MLNRLVMAPACERGTLMLSLVKIGFMSSLLSFLFNQLLFCCCLWIPLTFRSPWAIGKSVEIKSIVKIVMKCVGTCVAQAAEHPVVYLGSQSPQFTTPKTQQNVPYEAALPPHSLLIITKYWWMNVNLMIGFSPLDSKVSPFPCLGLLSLMLSMLTHNFEHYIHTCIDIIFSCSFPRNLKVSRKHRWHQMSNL